MLLRDSRPSRSAREDLQLTPLTSASRQGLHKGAIDSHSHFFGEVGNDLGMLNLLTKVFFNALAHRQFPIACRGEIDATSVGQ